MASRMKRGFLLRLAVKNLGRYRRRTMITAIAIAIGVAIFIAMHSALEGFSAESDRTFATYETGTAAVTGEEYWDERDKRPLDIAVEEPESVIAAWDDAGIPAAPRIIAAGTLIVHYDPYPEGGSVHVELYGIDPEQDPAVFGIRDSMEEGRFLQPGEEGVLIGRRLADRLGAEVGYPVTITTRTRDGFHQIMDLEIVGIFNTPNPVVNRTALYLPIATADVYLEMGGAVTSVHAKLPGRLPAQADPGPAREAVRDISGIDFLTFTDMNREMIEVMEMEDAANRIILGLLALIAVVGISNTMLMAVLEREREIGMMRALGWRKAEIRRLFMYEAGGIGLIGTLVGVALGAVLVALLVTYGLDYNAMMDVGEMDFRFDGILYGVWNPGVMLTAAVAATFIAGVAAVVPVRRILRRSIADSLRNV
ncbi:MAG: ABC transporter permease [Spirochaetota bacterium]